MATGALLLDVGVSRSVEELSLDAGDADGDRRSSLFGLTGTFGLSFRIAGFLVISGIGVPFNQGLLKKDRVMALNVRCRKVLYFFLKNHTQKFGFVKA